MNSVVLPSADQAKENAKKRKLIKITIVAASEVPYRVEKKRTGVVLGSFKTEDELDAFINQYPLAQLESKPTRGPRRS
jgi:hypothetical protein